jgi:flagellar motility protein MotE (MotC chaperone)
MMRSGSLFVFAVTIMAGAGAAESAGLNGQEEKEAVIQYCLNISDKAADARMARQAEILRTLEQKLEAKIAELETRRAEIQGWVEKQQQFQSAAQEGLVEIYATMDPEEAAKQMASLDTKLASSVLRQLKPRQASTILNEMKPEQAALLIKTIAATAKREEKPQ